jgi:hypothetical protein
MGRKGGRQNRLTGDPQSTVQAAGASLLEAAAVQLRAKRYSYREIAAELHVSVTGAYKAVKRGLAKVRRVVTHEAENLVAMELESLDMAAKAIKVMVAGGDLDAVDRWLKLHDRRKALLGIAPAATVAVTGLGGGPLTVELSWGEGQAPAEERTPAIGFEVTPRVEEEHEDPEQGRGREPRKRTRPARGASSRTPRRTK